jgi:hypothetical protein
MTAFGPGSTVVLSSIGCRLDVDVVNEGLVLTPSPNPCLEVMTLIELLARLFHR